MSSISKIINDFIKKDLDVSRISLHTYDRVYRIGNLTKIFNITGATLKNYMSNFILDIDVRRVYIRADTRMENTLTTKGIHKLISHQLTSGKKIDDFVLKYFDYDRFNLTQFKNSSQKHEEETKFAGNPDVANNIYVKKLKHYIFPKDKILVNYNVPGTDFYVDVYFPEYNIVILLEECKGRKRSTVIKRELPKNHLFNKATWLYFTEYKNPHSFNKFLSFVGKITSSKK